MRVIRIHTHAALAPGAAIRLSADAAAHVRRVLRLGPGDAVTLFNGDGWDYPGTLGEPTGGQLVVTLAGRIPAAAESPLAITLVQGVSRSDRMDIVLQKATELGVARIVPVLADRSVVRLDREQAARKLAHWQGIVIAACEQCGRAVVPELTAPVKLESFLEAPSAARVRLLLALGAPRSLPTAVAGAGTVELLIGPEGGLTPAEQAAAHAAGFERVLLGPRTLRTETAAIAALAILQSSAGDLS
jgi:16S rRNA (uracil1498-N3)-methyltransferase